MLVSTLNVQTCLEPTPRLEFLPPPFSRHLIPGPFPFEQSITSIPIFPDQQVPIEHDAQGTNTKTCTNTNPFPPRFSPLTQIRPNKLEDPSSDTGGRISRLQLPGPRIRRRINRREKCHRGRVLSISPVVDDLLCSILVLEIRMQP